MRAIHTARKWKLPTLSFGALYLADLHWWFSVYNWIVFTGPQRVISPHTSIKLTSGVNAGFPFEVHVCSLKNNEKLFEESDLHVYKKKKKTQENDCSFNESGGNTVYFIETALINNYAHILWVSPIVSVFFRRPDFCIPRNRSTLMPRDMASKIRFCNTVCMFLSV